MPAGKLSGGVLLWMLTFTGLAYGVDAPMTYLRGYGEKAYPVVQLTWGVLGIAIAVIVIISLLVVWAISRRPRIKLRLGEPMHLERPPGGLRWVLIGTSLTFIVLLATILWTVAVLQTAHVPAIQTPITIAITGHQWWWQVRYLSQNPAEVFTTANEIHIPVHMPVLFKLTSDDVIHSFWIPALSGKTDTIPGLTNETWMEASEPGVYYGQCTEYCGMQHAHMGILVVAESSEDFTAWRTHQMQSPEPAASATIAAGEKNFTAHCGGCHSVRGSEANGLLGPDLSHLMQRKRIASGLLENNPDNLARWISDPQGIKPGSLMQKPELTPTEFADIRDYLLTLR